MKITTIKLDKAVHKELTRLKIHPREPYSDVIKRIIKGELNGEAASPDASDSK